MRERGESSNQSTVSQVVAIDGPSGSGKSTIAKRVAKELSILYVDTGAMFRGVAAHFYSKKILSLETTLSPKGDALRESDQKSIDSIIREIPTLQIEYGQKKNQQNHLISINKVDLTNHIREHHISALASTISRIVPVRTALLLFQQQLAKEQTCVMEGRDIGTVVFPNAFCKIFLTASISERANRRYLELKEKGQDPMPSYEELKTDIEKRDTADYNREFAPLKKASDALLVESDHKSLEEITSIIREEITRKLQIYGLSLIQRS